MKQNKQIFWLMGLVLALMACQDTEEPYNNIPSLDLEVGYQLNKEDVSNVLVYYTGNINHSEAYFLISESQDMVNARRVEAEYNEHGSTWANLYDLQPATTYYFSFHHFLDHGDVESAQGSFTTYRYALTPITITTNYSNVRNAGFFIFDDNETFASNKQVGCDDDMSYVPSVRIMGEATVYLYRPWQNGSFSYDKVPVNNNMGNFEYGQSIVTPPSPNGTCEMNSLAYEVNINIKAQSTNDMTSVKEITGLEIGNAEGSTAISNSGTCDIPTGTVTPIAKSTDRLTAKMEYIPLSKKESTTVKFRSLIPATFADKEVVINVQISDGSNIAVNTPVYLPGAEWKAGNSYTYDVVVEYTRNAIEVFISDVSVQSWTDGGNDRIDIED